MDRFLEAETATNYVFLLVVRLIYGARTHAQLVEVYRTKWTVMLSAAVAMDFTAKHLPDSDIEDGPTSEF